jgi:hypothetical protein
VLQLWPRVLSGYRWGLWRLLQSCVRLGLYRCVCHFYPDRNAHGHVDTNEHAHTNSTVLQLWPRVLSGFYQWGLWHLLQCCFRLGLCGIRLRPVYSHRHTADADDYTHRHHNQHLDANAHPDQHAGG